ncbi:Cyclin-dependent kinases regulatory subunit 2 [Lemmus lemmus]
MSEEEWRRLGIQQSLGWVHYMIHEPEPHILLFRRPLQKSNKNEVQPDHLIFFKLNVYVYIR